MIDYDKDECRTDDIEFIITWSIICLLIYIFGGHTIKEFFTNTNTTTDYTSITNKISSIT